jgi:hypothetical protein
MTGPVEYLVAAFPDGTINDDIAPELTSLIDKKIIRLLDLVFVVKDYEGDVTVLEFDELDNLTGYAEIEAEIGGWIGQDDIDYVTADLSLGSAAAILLVEDLWAAPLANALTRSGALLADGGRIPRDLVDDAVAALAA